MSTKAIIFDLDGVILSTDNYHYKAWKKMADEENIYFDRKINEQLRGISRMNSLEIILKNSNRKYTSEEKQNLADKKNSYYKELIKNISPDDVFDGVIELLDNLKHAKIKIAIGSSSKNALDILKNAALINEFDAIIDGNCITCSKPNPEVFLKASEAINIPPSQCMVIEDSEAGVTAALTCGMKIMAVGYASQTNQNVNYRLNSIVDIKCIDDILK